MIKYLVAPIHYEYNDEYYRTGSYGDESVKASPANWLFFDDYQSALEVAKQKSFTALTSEYEIGSFGEDEGWNSDLYDKFCEKHGVKYPIDLYPMGYKELIDFANKNGYDWYNILPKMYRIYEVDVDKTK